MLWPEDMAGAPSVVVLSARDDLVPFDLVRAQVPLPPPPSAPRRVLTGTRTVPLSLCPSVPLSFCPSVLLMMTRELLGNSLDPRGPWHSRSAPTVRGGGGEGFAVCDFL